MTDSFDSYLSESQAGSALLLEALRVHVTQASGLTEAAMEDRLRQTGPAAHEREVQRLATNSKFLTRAARDYFEKVWQEPARRESVKLAFDAAKSQKSPVRTRSGAKNALLAVVALYALSLTAAQPRKDQTALPPPNASHVPAQAQSAENPRMPLFEQAFAAFSRDLPGLLQTSPRKWVAYRGAERLSIQDTQTDAVLDCRRRGYDTREVYTGCVFPGADEEVEVFLRLELDDND